MFQHGVGSKSMCLDILIIAVGLILADSANMLMRIGYSWRFIKLTAADLQFRDWAPSFRSCAVSAVAAVTLSEFTHYATLC